VVTIGMKAEMELFGKPMEMSSTIKQEFDADGKLVSFSSLKDGPKGKSKMSGELRDDGGYEITRKEKGKTEKVTVSPDEYDFHSSDPRMYAGKVGSKNKYTVLALGAGEVRKVTVKILGRETREIGGKQVEVTHFVAKGMDGSMEEWRMDDGVLLKSKIKTPIGKIIVELEEP